MLYRKYYVQDNFRLGDAGTRTIDVNIQDPITAFWIKFQSRNGATVNKANLLPQCISSIQLIDGADVLYSLSGQQAYALAAYQLGQMQENIFDESGTDPQTFSFPMMFGTKFGDKARSFDPRRFKNPQLRFTWNLAAVNVIGANGFLGGDLALSVLADVMEGAPTPQAFLMHKEIYTWTSAAAGWEYIDLPMDFPYRGMMLRGVKANTVWHWIFDQLRMNCDGGQHIAMNIRGWDLMNWLATQLPIFHYTHCFRVSDGDTIQCVLRDHESVQLEVDAVADTTTLYTNAGWGSGAVATRTTGAAGAANMKMYADIQGRNPFGCAYIPFGDQADPADWFPTRSFKGIRMEIRGGVVNSANSLVLTQDRPY